MLRVYCNQTLLPRNDEFTDIKVQLAPALMRAEDAECDRDGVNVRL